MKYGQLKAMVDGLGCTDDQDVKFSFLEIGEYGYSWRRTFDIKDVQVLNIEKTIVLNGEEPSKGGNSEDNRY